MHESWLAEQLSMTEVPHRQEAHPNKPDLVARKREKIRAERELQPLFIFSTLHSCAYMYMYMYCPQSTVSHFTSTLEPNCPILC